jgi:cell division protein FtsB
MTKMHKLSLAAIIFLVLFVAVCFVGRNMAQASKTPTDAQIESLQKEMKALSEENKKNGCSENSDRWDKLSKAVAALQGF